jgi:hypothetical protein
MGRSLSSFLKLEVTMNKLQTKFCKRIVLPQGGHTFMLMNPTLETNPPVGKTGSWSHPTHCMRIKVNFSKTCNKGVINMPNWFLYQTTQPTPLAMLLPFASIVVISIRATAILFKTLQYVDTNQASLPIIHHGVMSCGSCILFQQCCWHVPVWTESIPNHFY